MTDERPSDEEVTGMVAELVTAGLLTIARDRDGAETWTLTPTGAQVARQMSMSSDDDAVAILTALVEAGEPDTTQG